MSASSVAVQNANQAANVGYDSNPSLITNLRIGDNQPRTAQEINNIALSITLPTMVLRSHLGIAAHESCDVDIDQDYIRFGNVYKKWRSDKNLEGCVKDILQRAGIQDPVAQPAAAQAQAQPNAQQPAQGAPNGNAAQGNGAGQRPALSEQDLLELGARYGALEAQNRFLREKNDSQEARIQEHTRDLGIAKAQRRRARDALRAAREGKGALSQENDQLRQIIDEAACAIGVAKAKFANLVQQNAALKEENEELSGRVQILGDAQAQTEQITQEALDKLRELTERNKLLERNNRDLQEHASRVQEQIAKLEADLNASNQAHDSQQEVINKLEAANQGYFDENQQLVEDGHRAEEELRAQLAEAEAANERLRILAQANINTGKMLAKLDGIGEKYRKFKEETLVAEESDGENEAEDWHDGSGKVPNGVAFSDENLQQLQSPANHKYFEEPPAWVTFLPNASDRNDAAVYTNKIKLIVNRLGSQRLLSPQEIAQLQDEFIERYRTAKDRKKFIGDDVECDELERQIGQRIDEIIASRTSEPHENKRNTHKVNGSEVIAEESDDSDHEQEESQLVAAQAKIRDLEFEKSQMMERLENARRLEEFHNSHQNMVKPRLPSELNLAAKNSELLAQVRQLEQTNQELRRNSQVNGAPANAELAARPAANENQKSFDQLLGENNATRLADREAIDRAVAEEVRKRKEDHKYKGFFEEQRTLVTIKRITGDLKGAYDALFKQMTKEELIQSRGVLASYMSALNETVKTKIDELVSV